MRGRTEWRQRTRGAFLGPDKSFVRDKWEQAVLRLDMLLFIPPKQNKA